MDDINEDWMREFNRLFGRDGMGVDFEAIQRYMDRMMEEMMINGAEISRGEPYIYGFTLRMDPDGQPQIQRFGNTEPGHGFVPNSRGEKAGQSVSERREPLTDIIESDDRIHVTIEIPGVEKKDIDLEIREKALVISVDSEYHGYYKEIRLPCSVDMSMPRATYNNGVLDVTLTKQERKCESVKVRIE